MLRTAIAAVLLFTASIDAQSLRVVGSGDASRMPGSVGTTQITNDIIPAHNYLVHNATQVEFANAAHTSPTIVVATAGALPGTCTAGELAFVTGATAGQNVYECGSANTWTQQSGAGSSSVALASGNGTPASTSTACTSSSTSVLGVYVDTSAGYQWWCSNGGVWQQVQSSTQVGAFTLTGTAGTFSTGVASSRPSCSTVSYYLATDTHALTMCNGTSWGGTLNASGSQACIMNSTADAFQCYDSSGNLTSKSYTSTAAQTTVGGSSSGNCIFSEPLTGAVDHKTVVYLSAETGTCSYSFATAYTNTPGIFASSAVAAAVVTSLSTSAVTLTGLSSTGFIILEGY